MGKEIECPYCGSHGDHDGESYEEDHSYEWQCGNCDKNFIVRPHYSIWFSSEIADCLNDGKHIYSRQIGYPEEWMKTVCEICGKQLPGEKLPHPKGE